MLKKMTEERNAVNKVYNQVLSSLMKYEESNVEYYSDLNLKNRYLTHPSKSEFRDSFDYAYN